MARLETLPLEIVLNILKFVPPDQRRPLHHALALQCRVLNFLLGPVMPPLQPAEVRSLHTHKYDPEDPHCYRCFKSFPHHRIIDLDFFPIEPQKFSKTGVVDWRLVKHLRCFDPWNEGPRLYCLACLTQVLSACKEILDSRLDIIGPVLYWWDYRVHWCSTCRRLEIPVRRDATDPWRWLGLASLKAMTCSRTSDKEMADEKGRVVVFEYVAVELLMKEVAKWKLLIPQSDAEFMTLEMILRLWVEPDVELGVVRMRTAICKRRMTNTLGKDIDVPVLF